MSLSKKEVPKPKILCLDFDGVLHSYISGWNPSGWRGAGRIPDPPVDGAIEWLKSLLGTPDKLGIAPRYLDFKVCIYSSRSQFWGGIQAMKKWLVKWGLNPAYFELLEFPKQKPAAFLTIDDRAITFTGRFPDPKELARFETWNKLGVSG